MALDYENYEPALMYGNSVINGDNITAATIAASAGTMKASYYTLAAGTTGNTAVSVFNGQTTAPVAGTVTGFYTVNATAVAGTFVLWGTTAGTIATIAMTGTTAALGAIMGTSVLNAAVASGDTLQVSSIQNAGTATGFVTFWTTN